jgi:hypothetical protein
MMRRLQMMRRTQVVFESPDCLLPQEAEAIKHKWREAIAKRQPMVLTGGLTYREMTTVKPNDAFLSRARSRVR